MKSILKNKEIFIIIFIYVVVILFFQQSLGMREDAGTFPRLLSVIIFILNTIYTINFLRGKVKIIKNKEELSILKFYKILVASLVYVILLKLIGFVISSLIFLIGSMKILEVKNFKLNIVISILTIVIIYVCFGLLLNVPMPTGYLNII